MADKLGIKLSSDDKKLEGKALLKNVMSSWLPCADACSKMIATHIPNPQQAQKGRSDVLYKGERRYYLYRGSRDTSICIYFYFSVTRFPR
jgi:hypothetical protein